MFVVCDRDIKPKNQGIKSVWMRNQAVYINEINEIKGCRVHIVETNAMSMVTLY